MARLRVELAENRWAESKEKAREARRKRKEAKAGARQAKKESKQARKELAEARSLLKDAEAHLAQSIESVNPEASLNDPEGKASVDPDPVVIPAGTSAEAEPRGSLGNWR